MRRLIIICLFLCTIHLLANDNYKKIQVTGKPIRYEGGITKEIRNILFLKERADLRIPNKIFLFQLNEASAKEMGKDKIWLIPVNEFGFNNSTLYNYEEYNIHLNQDKEITVDIYPVTDFNSSLYYSNDDVLLSAKAKKQIEKQKKFWQKPQEGDTIASHLFTSESDFRNTLQKIKQLDNNAPVVHEFEVSEYLIDKIQGREYDSIVVHTMPEMVKEIALGELNQLYYLDDFRPPADIKTKKEWMEWYNSLPQPIFDKPDVSVPIFQIPYSDEEIDGFSSRIFQNEENRFIYSLSSREGYVLDTKNDIVTKIDSTLFSFFNAPTNDNDYGESHSMGIEDEWLKDGENVYESKAIELTNGNIVIASIQSNKFQLKFYLHKLSKDSNKPDKGVLFHCMIPLEDHYLLGLFEANGKLYFVYNTNSSAYANIAIIDNSMLKEIERK